MSDGGAINRRGFVKGLAGVGLAGIAGASTLAQGYAFPTRGSALHSRTPPPSGSHRVSRPPGLRPDHGRRPRRYRGRRRARSRTARSSPSAEVFDAPGASPIDGRDTIVMPGFVDTHWHMWTTYLRCMAGDKARRRIFSGHDRVRSGDAARRHVLRHAAGRGRGHLSGITTVSDDCHNVRTHEHAVAGYSAR